MKTYLKKVVKLLPVFIVLTIAISLRFTYLDRIPTGINGDELIYILQAKSIATTGRDIMGTWQPLSALIFQYPEGERQTELPYLLLTPYFRFVPLSLLNARIPYALISVLTVLIIYLLATKLLGKSIGFFSGLSAAINPWLVFIGRTNYEAGLATFFFPLSLFLMFTLKGKWIFLLLPILLCAFYSYIGTKLIFLPFIILGLSFVYSYKKNRHYLNKYYTIALFSVFLVGFYLFTIKGNPVQSRMSELVTWKSPEIEQTTQELRRTMINMPFTRFFVNKATVYMRMIYSKFCDIFSYHYLFVFGDQFISIWQHGVFYFIDLLFIIFGAITIYSTNKKVFYYITLIIILSTFPHLFHQTKQNFTPHVTLMFPFFSILIGAGIWNATQIIQSRWYAFFSRIFIIIFYIFSVLYFFVIYFYHYPLQGYSDFHKRVLTRYLNLNIQQKKQITVHTQRELDLFKKFIFYSNTYNETTNEIIKKGFKHNQYTIETLTIDSCFDTIQPEEQSKTLIYDIECGKIPDVKMKKNILRLSDGGQLYVIYNDSICSQYQLNPFPYGIQIKDFDIESLSEERFCKTYISN